MAQIFEDVCPNFEGILSRDHGNFEEQNKVLEHDVIINYLIIIIIITDRTIPNNKPDIIIHDNEKGTCMLIDVAISGDKYVIKKKQRRF